MGCTNTSKKISETDQILVLVSYFFWCKVASAWPEPKGSSWRWQSQEAEPCSSSWRGDGCSAPGRWAAVPETCPALLLSHGAHISEWDGGKEGRILITKERDLPGLQESLVLAALLIFLYLNCVELH